MPGLRHVKAATALAGVVGTLVVFGVGVGLAQIFVGRGGPRGIDSDAA